MVVRLMNKTKKDFITPPAQQSITMSRSNSDLISSVTMLADGGIGVTSAPVKATRVRSTATATQMRRKAAFEKKNEYNTAFKCATIV